MSDIQWRLKGTCHKFGDNLEHDGSMMNFKYVIDRVYDAETLVPHLFEDTRPDLLPKLKAGDILVAGKGFGHGKAHVQAYIAMRALGLGVVCESMPFLTYRAAIGRGLMLMTDCQGVADEVDDGDQIEVDFATGEFINHTRGTRKQYAPLPDALRGIVALGGTNGVLLKWWNEQKAVEAAGAAS